MVKSERLALIAKAQALRDKGISAREAAKRLGMSKRWMDTYTHGFGKSPGRPTNRRKYARERCIDFFAYALEWYRGMVVG